MIGFWIAAAALTALALLPIIRALLKPRVDGGHAAAYARSVYAAQMAEVERDLKRGVLNADQAQQARAEIGRRLLGAAAEAEGVEAQVAGPAAPSTKLALALILALPLLALALYLPFGNPNLPAQIFAERTDRQVVPPQVLTAVANLERSLQTNPNDLAGWTLLAQTYGAMGRPDDAVTAYRKALGLSQGDAELMGALGEALTNANDGMVDEEARRLFEASVAADPMAVRARFYLGLARQQAGDPKGALERWAALVGDSPANAPWLPMVRQQIQQVAVTIGVDPATVTPAPKPVQEAPPAPGAAAPALSPEQMQAMQGMSADQQRETIAGMVAGLAAKLEQNPGDVDGWLRLARAREVMGEVEAARTAARRATEADPQRLDAWLALGQLLAPEQNDGTAGAEFLTVMRRVLDLRPDNPQALYYLGQQAANEGDVATARRHWQKLIETLPANAPERPEVQRRLDALNS